MNIRDFALLDVFCGVGGLTHGFFLEGFEIIAGIDSDSSCRFAFEKNNHAPFFNWDLTVTPSKKIIDIYPPEKGKILVGCAPCQAFSHYTKKQKNDKWKLVSFFGKIIEEVNPDIVSMENVPSLLRYKKGKVFQDFIYSLEHIGFENIWYDIIEAQNYGVPQDRKRLILIASKIGPIEFVPPTNNNRNYVSLRDAIGHLPPIKHGEIHPDDMLHRSRELSPLNNMRIMATPEGGGWKDWPEKLILECHKKETGKSYRSVYGRMRWDDIAPTLTTQCTGYGNGRYGHPEQDRAISLREAAILQSFPEDYQLIDNNAPFHPSWIERHIGNAVPVLLARAIAKSIKKNITIHG